MLFEEDDNTVTVTAELAGTEQQRKAYISASFLHGNPKPQNTIIIFKWVGCIIY